MAFGCMDFTQVTSYKTGVNPNARSHPAIFSNKTLHPALSFCILQSPGYYSTIGLVLILMPLKFDELLRDREVLNADRKVIQTLLQG